MEDYNRIYPQLPEQGENFRLKSVSDFLSEMESELKEREATFNRYKKSFKFLSNLSASAGTLSVVLSGSGTGTTLTGVGLPVGASLAVLAAICGILSVSAGISVKKVSSKLDKHEKIVSLCRDKLSIVKSLVSKALNDGNISHEEFLAVQAEVQNYKDLNKEIQTKKKDSKEGRRSKFGRNQTSIRRRDRKIKRIVFKIELNCFVDNVESDISDRPPPYNPSY